MGREYELKFSATPQIQEAVLQQYLGETEEFSMETVYYDTPDGQISARRYTLRRRMENGRSVCTLKTPGNGRERGEWEAEAASVEEAIPQLCSLGAPEDLKDFLGTGLVPICGARFHRIARTITLPDAVLELACDRGILTGGGKEQPLCEIEVELKQGEPQSADDFGTALKTRFHLQEEPKSKFCRAFALYKGE